LNTYPFNNTELNEEERLADLMQRLTIEEKISLCAGQSWFKTKSIKRLGIKQFGMTDGPHGVAPHSSGFKRNTYFPTSIGLGATWNPLIAEKFGEAIAEETWAVGKHMILGPGVNICRTPLNGRTFEYLTEDPHLNKSLAVPIVKGIQSQRIAACVKHFVANNQETRRMRVNVNVSERALREIYLPAFEAAVKEADAWSIMACYNKVHGVHGCENKNLLTDRLRTEYGFSGFVVSDWFAARLTTSAESCMEAGLSLEMPGKGIKYRSKRLLQAFNEGKIAEETLDNNLKPLLRVMLRTGLFDDGSTLPKGSRNTPEHQAMARKIAEEGITLLKNQNRLLPLNIDNIKKLTIIGPNAKKKMSRPLYGLSSGVWPPYEITPFKGLKAKGKGKYKITSNTQNADAVIIVAGLNHGFNQDSEGKDRKQLELPKEQIDLIKKTAESNPNTIVVLINGSPIVMEDWIEEVPAVIEAWYPGMEGGHVIADVIFGDVNPSGKLPLTFPKQLSDSPAHASERTFPGDENVYYDEGVFVGYRHFDTRSIEPQFPFGFGLSYTSFSYDSLQLGDTKFSADGILDLSMRLTNTGDREGSEVVQLYVQEKEPGIERPLKELKHFQKIRLSPGDSETITFQLSASDLAYFDETQNQWTANEGRYALLIGSSSRDIRLKGEFEFI